MNGRQLLFLVLLLSVKSAGSYKILVYNSKFAHAHSAFLGRIADILVETGHNVTSLIPIIDHTLHDGTEKSHKIYVHADPYIHAVHENPPKVDHFGVDMLDPRTAFGVGGWFSFLFGRTCTRVLEEPGLIDRLRAEKYDLYITENFNYCGIGLAHAIAPKAVISSSASVLFGWLFDDFGVEQAHFSIQSLNVHSMIDRFWNLYAEILTRITGYYPQVAVDAILKEKFGPDYPTISQQSANVAYVLTSSEPLIETAAPTSHRVIDIGGIAASEPQPLDEYWQEVLGRRSKAVLFSFGSIVKSSWLPADIKMSIVETIVQLPNVTFIWKYEEPEDEFSREYASKVENLVLTKWMSQTDILGHANVSLFISHGGLVSVQEAAARGVPGIFVPICGDNARNAGMMQSNELGRVYDKKHLNNAEMMTATIREVLEDPKYATNAKRISKMLARKPFAARELLIKHVEFAAQFGASAALRPRSIDMNLIEYHNLDILIICVVTLILIFHIITRVITSFCRKIFVGKAKMD